MAAWPYCWPWPKIRKQILERDGHRCKINGPNCQGQANDVDHIISWQAGGAPYDPTNLRAACQTCNRGRTKYVKVDTTTPAPSRDW